MTREEALAALAELSDQRIHQQRLNIIAAALSANPPATWDQVGAALGQRGQHAHRKYARDLDVTVERRVRVKPNPAADQQP